MTELSLFMPLQGIAPGHQGIFERLQNYMINKNEVNENKIIFGDFNCTMDKTERDGRNKTLYRRHLNYAL